ncbi:MAG TPA: hypothetical protein PL048_23260 [Leptospiraceae bacterium]|nr:hypothetical protein [Leptospiraceae bacterium]
MKTIKIKNMTMGIPEKGMIQEGAMTPQEVLIESLRDNLSEFREAQHRVDSMRKSR